MTIETNLLLQDYLGLDTPKVREMSAEKLVDPYAVKPLWQALRIRGNLDWAQNAKAVAMYFFCGVMKDWPIDNDWWAFRNNASTPEQVKMEADALNEAHHEIGINVYTADSPYVNNKTRIVDREWFGLLLQDSKYKVMHMILRGIDPKLPPLPVDEPLNHGEAPELQSYEEIRQIEEFFEDTPRGRARKRRFQEASQIMLNFLLSQQGQSLASVWIPFDRWHVIRRQLIDDVTLKRLLKGEPAINRLIDRRMSDNTVALPALKSAIRSKLSRADFKWPPFSLD